MQGNLSHPQRVVQMSKALECRDRAEQCRRFAKESVSETVREHWLELAEFWERLASSEQASEWIDPSPIEGGIKHSALSSQP
jgi:hypothetical protein